MSSGCANNTPRLPANEGPSRGLLVVDDPAPTCVYHPDSLDLPLSQHYIHHEDDTEAQTPKGKRPAWLILLILPGRLAVGALTFAAGASVTKRPLSHPLAVLSGTVVSLTAQLLISTAIRRTQRRAGDEWDLAEKARLQRMQWLDAVQAVGKVVDRFANDLVGPATMRNLFLDTSLARMLHRVTLNERFVLARTRPQTRPDILEAGRHYLDFALATYGFLLLKLLGIVSPTYDVMAEGGRAEDVARFLLNLGQNDIVLSRLDGEEINLPRHFVALDHTREAVVVAIRGTNSISDIITDLICENEPFASGYAHAGMKSAAEVLLTSLTPTLRDILARFRRYSLVVTGHSLGAGVSMLLTKLLLDAGFTGVKCYAIAPCPVFGPMHKVDSDWSDALECFVHTEDMVATLCLSSARNLALQMEHIQELSLSPSQKKDLIRQEDINTLNNMLRKQKTVQADPREKEVEQLYIPCHHGIHWLIPEADPQQQSGSKTARSSTTGISSSQHNALSYRDGAGDDSQTACAYRPSKRFGCYIMRPRFFERISVTAECVSAHFPNSYTAAFAGLDLPERKVALPRPRQNLVKAWYSGELG